MASLSPRTSRRGAADELGSIRYTLTVLPRTTETKTAPPAAARETRLLFELLAGCTVGVAHWPSGLPVERL